MRLILVTGLSGSGKSVVLNLLEDAGFYTVDNLPISLLLELVQTLRADGHQRVAVAADARLGLDIHTLEHVMNELRTQGTELTVLFLNARVDTLIQRYSETRRRHPMSLNSRSDIEGVHESKTLLECIEEERELLAPIERLGIPLDADLVFDVRCLPNPHYVEALKPQTGKHDDVIDYLAAQPVVAEMIQDIAAFLKKWLPHYLDEHRSYLTVALGCTGGQHRSVYCAEKLSQIFRPEWPVMVRHRSLIRRGLD
ncbi:MAG: RNase adaptor protein RapZ [Betaproteobacteria bacterium]|nr:RNase adaptor protein RapZ [Betaproteobacteria bacterium]